MSESDDGERSLSFRRKARCIADPMAFARVYLSHHLKSDATGGQVTFSDAHHLWCEIAMSWRRPGNGPLENRHAFVAPRETGKSTWWFLILPLWAAAYGHAKFIAAFADSATQAETHLASLKHELETNAKLREDFPQLCQPARRARGIIAADNRAMLHTASGFVMTARGADSAVLGLKVGELRPDLLLIDDIEPEERRYSAEQMKGRLGTLRDGIFPLNVNARVVLVGTVTMVGSIIHQLVQVARGGANITSEARELEWITEEKITPHYSAPILTDDDGTERSLWPGRWSLEFLQSIRHTRSYAKNYANDPRGIDGGYWNDEDFTYRSLPGVTRRLLSVDPAVTTKKSSDPTGLAVVSMEPEEINARTRKVTKPRMVQVEHAEEVRLTGTALRTHCMKIVERWEADGRPIGLLYIESNQGGEVWEDIFHDFPVPVRIHQATIKKEVRAASALAFYQLGRVVHEKRLASAEEQMITFPVAPHDDMVDAVGAGVLRFLDPPKKPKVTARSVSTV